MEEQRDWFTYVLIDRLDASIYTGYTVDSLETRLKRHNGLLKGGARSTARRRIAIQKKTNSRALVWRFGFVIRHDNAKAARSLETRLKKHVSIRSDGTRVDLDATTPAEFRRKKSLHRRFWRYYQLQKHHPDVAGCIVHVDPLLVPLVNKLGLAPAE